MKKKIIKRPKRIIVKYGGASLADDKGVSKAVTAVAKEATKGTQIVVVVSAIGKTTDFLLQVTRDASNDKVGKEELDDILATGERTSVRIFAAALRARGVSSLYFDPLNLDWPIITDNAFSNANPILEQCEGRIQQLLLPLLDKNFVPVIPGFVGKTFDEKITTLGRGGSDTTAFILAKALKADEVILVSDADGIMSADPKLLSNPARLEQIDVATLVRLADIGAKFIHRKALKYKDPSIDVRLINHAHGDLSKEGTLITGALSSEMQVSLASKLPAISVKILGLGISEKSKVIKELVEKVNAHTRLLGLSADHNSMILYAMKNKDLNSLLESIHETVLKNERAVAMAVRRQLAFITIKGVGLEETPGILGKISEILRLNEINIFGILTIASSILLFVDWNKRGTVLSLIENSLRGNRT